MLVCTASAYTESLGPFPILVKILVSTEPSTLSNAMRGRGMRSTTVKSPPMIHLPFNPSEAGVLVM